MTQHSFDQHLKALRSALEQDKLPLAIMLGAGAPMALRVGGQPLIPDLAGLTSLVHRDLEDGYKPALRALVGHLDKADQGNLELVLNYVRALAALPGRSPSGLEPDVNLKELDAEICRVVRQHVGAELPEGESPYVEVANWVRAVQRLTPVQIFTTNYDLLMEQALERQRVAYFDGFMGSHQPIFDIQAIEEDALPPRWTLLWKLHGSMNWSQDRQGDVRRRDPKQADGDSALIYPSHLKYDQSRRLPYLAMMDRLRTFLRRPGAFLMTCGYSYRDQHINEVLDQGLRNNPSASVHGLLFGDLVQYHEARTLARDLHNLTLMASDAGVIGTFEGDWAMSEEDSADTGCRLGDFAALGQFLRELTGASVRRSEPDGVANVV